MSLAVLDRQGCDWTFSRFFRGSTRRAVSRAPVLAVLTMIAVALPVAGGCRDDSTASRAAQDDVTVDPEQSEKLFDYSLDLLNHLDDYNEFNNDRALEQIVARLNEWAAHRKSDASWQLDPLVETLPAAYARLPVVADLAGTRYLPYDGPALRSAVWMRNVSRQARGEQIGDVQRAASLFDWTVRNIQLEPPRVDEADAPIQLPWHTLLFGRGSTLDRAWVFIQLARQQHLDVCLLAYRNAQPPHELVPWVVGLWSEGELYLFDPQLGLPIPGPDGRGVATLTEAVSDPSVLDQLDVDEDHPYPVKAEVLNEVVALIEASPEFLSRRMKAIESRLAGERSLVLSVDASAQAERFASHPHVHDAELWTLPYERIRRLAELDRDEIAAEMRRYLPFRIGDAMLWKGRILHLYGRFVGEPSANEFYQSARPSSADIQQAHLAAEQAAIVEEAKQDASYWLALVAFERGQYDAAVNHLQKRTLDASPGGPWTDGARYNLGRAYEAKGELDRAIAIYESDQSPQQHGNRLRARRLRETATADAAAR